MTIEIEQERSQKTPDVSRTQALISKAEPPPVKRRPDQLARALGWFSVGLGLAETLAPRSVSRAIGVRGDPRLLRALGARELASGLAILTQRRPGPLALQARVAGDVIDLGLMAAAWNARHTDRARLAAGAAAVLGVTALDVWSARSLREALPRSPLVVSANVAIQRSPAELYEFWRKPENWSRIMSHAQVVEAREGRRFHVESEPVLGRNLSWEGEITEDVPHERIAWRSLPDAAIATYGRITFTPLPGGRGSSLQVRLEFQPPARALAAPFARLLGSAPNDALTAALRRFKQWSETGEIATTEGQPSGRRSLMTRHLP